MSQWEKCELEFDQKYAALLADLNQHKELINEQLFCTKVKMDLEFIVQIEHPVHSKRKELLLLQEQPSWQLHIQQESAK